MSFAEVDLLVLGASMLGVELVHQVRRRAKRGLRVVVIDRQSRHPYIPLCHERLSGRIPMGTSELDTAAFVAADPDTRFVEAEIVGFDAKAHVARLAGGDEVRGRVVVVALGSELGPPKMLPGAERLLELKAAAAWEKANRGLQAVLGGGSQGAEVVVVGGGISGVELAGELAHLRRERPAGWGIPKVTLVHDGERLLPGLTPAAGRRAKALLERQGARVLLGTRLVAVNEADVAVTGGAGQTSLPCALAFWAGGLRPPALVRELGLPLTKTGWLTVGPTLQCFPTPVPTDPELFAAGDVARIQGGEGEWPTMQRAIECIWQAKTVAQNVATLLAEPPGYPEGVPPLQPHVLRTDFPHGVSIGAHSLIVYGRAVTDLGRVSVGFRRWLMSKYLDRYAARVS